MAFHDYDQRASEVAECVLDAVAACKLPWMRDPSKTRLSLDRARLEFERIISDLGHDQAASFADATCVLLAGSLLDPWNSHAGLDERLLRLTVFYFMLAEWGSPVMSRVSLYTVQCLCVEARTAVNAMRALRDREETLSHTQTCIARIDAGEVIRTTGTGTHRPAEAWLTGTP